MSSASLKEFDETRQVEDRSSGWSWKKKPYKEKTIYGRWRISESHVLQKKKKSSQRLTQDLRDGIEMIPLTHLIQETKTQVWQIRQQLDSRLIDLFEEKKNQIKHFWFKS